MKVELRTHPDDLTEAWKLLERLRAGTTKVAMPVDMLRGLLMDHSNLATKVGQNNLLEPPRKAQ